jgi:LysM repeat protein
VPADWSEYTVVEGDTLSDIAERFDTSSDELVEVNCLENADQIFVGQKLYVPGSASADAEPDEFINFFLIIPEDNGESGPLVGCGDSAVAVWRDRTRTDSIPDDLQASLEELFSIKTEAYGETGFVHSLHNSDLAVQSVAVDNGSAVIDLTGTLQLVGTCADARMEAQILLTVFQYPGVDSAMITIDGTNLKQLFDTSGTVGDSEPYSRPDSES